MIITDQASSDNDQSRHSYSELVQSLSSERRAGRDEEATLGDHGIGFRKEKRN